MVLEVTKLFFESYLSNRKQYSKENNYSSNFQTIECGVPQGSVMGPLLFLINVNDLPCASFQTTLFADDTSLHLSHKDIKTLQLNVLNELDKVDTWMRSNRLSMNYNKTAYMILTTTRSQNCNFEISMNMWKYSKLTVSTWSLSEVSGVQIWKFCNHDPIRNFFINSISNPYSQIENYGPRYLIRNRSLSYTLANIFGSLYFASWGKSSGYFAISETLHSLKWSCDKDKKTVARV